MIGLTKLAVEIAKLKEAIKQKDEALKEANSVMLDVEVHIDDGIIPLLEHLQRVHPQWQEECVFRCIEQLREQRDELDKAEELIKQVVSG